MLISHQNKVIMRLSKQFFYIFLFICTLSQAGSTGANLPSAKPMAALKKAFEHAKKMNVVKSSIVTLVDYSLPSNKPRLWVIDMVNQKVIKQTTVAHGKYSGWVLPTSFSNAMGSLKSSIGVFVTGSVYQGKHGQSMRLIGLESGFNDKAAERGIVVHGANYVHEQCFGDHGLCTGRSFGCPAVATNEIKDIIKHTASGSLWVSYYPDQHWLSKSRFLV